MPRQTAPPHLRGGLRAREIRILELTQPPSRGAVRKSFKHFKSRLHPSTTWVKNESTSCSETSRRFGPAALPFLSATPGAITEKEKKKNGTVCANHASPRGDSFDLSIPLPLRSQPREKALGIGGKVVFETLETLFQVKKQLCPCLDSSFFVPAIHVGTRANTRSDFID